MNQMPAPERSARACGGRVATMPSSLSMVTATMKHRV
jgi:hypothetical protein